MCKMKKFPQSLLAFFIVLVKEEKIKVLALPIYRILLYNPPTPHTLTRHYVICASSLTLSVPILVNPAWLCWSFFKRIFGSLVVFNQILINNKSVK